MAGKKSTVKIVSYSTIVIAVLLCFRSFLAITYPDLDSDHAIHILMSADLHLPDDLYYWGQSRLGSFIPITSSLLLQSSSLSPAAAVSWIQGIILAIGFICFSSLLNSYFAKTLFSIFWFLPLTSFSALVQPTHPYAAQLAFTGVAVVIFCYFFKHIKLNSLKKNLLLSAGVSALFISLWISELSLVVFGFIVLFFISFWFRSYKYLKAEFLYGKLHSSYKISYLANIIVSSVIWCCFLIYAKIVPQSNKLTSVRPANTLNEVFHIIQQVSKAILNALTFKSNNLFLSIHVLLVVTIILFLAFIFIFKRQFKITLYTDKKKWLILFFAWQLLANLGLLIASHWVYLNNVHPRYFTVAYVFFWLLVLSLLEYLQKRSRYIAYFLISLAAISSILTLPSYVFSLNQPVSKIQQLQELTSLGQAGFIGDYWHSYVLCSVKPEQLSCTPHENSYVRCSRCASQTLSAPNLYLVKEGWLESFPQHIEQFGVLLEKQGEEKHISQYTIAPYHVKNQILVFDFISDSSQSLDIPLAIDGLSGLEKNFDNQWRWALGEKTTIAFNLYKDQLLDLSFSFYNPIHNQNVTIEVNGKIVENINHIDANTMVEKQIQLEGKTGINTISFIYKDWNGNKTNFAPNDPRPMSVSFISLNLQKLSQDLKTLK